MTSVAICELTNLRNRISANDGHQAGRELCLNRAGGSCYTTDYGA